MPSADLKKTFSDASIFAWFVVAICLGQWIPCDSIGVLQGLAICQQMIWLLLAVAVASMQVFRRESPTTSNSKLIAGILLSMFAWLAIDTCLQQGHANMRNSINAMWQWAVTLLIFWITPKIVNDSRKKSLVVTLLLGLILSAAFHGLYQYVWSMPRDRAAFAADPEAVLLRSKIDAPPGSAMRLLFKSRLDSTEPFGPYSLANSLAGTLVVGIALLLGSRFLSVRKIRLCEDTVIACLASVVFFGILFLTKSRTGWIAAAFCIGMLAVFHPKFQSIMRGRWKLGIAGCCGLIAVATLIVAWYDPLILLEAPKSLAFRWLYWQASACMISDHPLLGVGLGGFQDNFARYKTILSSETINDPHSFVVETLALLGIPGFLLLMVGIFYFAKQAKHCLLNSKQAALEPSNLHDDELNIHRIATTIGVGFTALLVLLIPNLVGPSPDDLPYWMILAVMIAWLWVHPADMKTSNKYVWVAVAGMLVHLLASGGWMSPGCTNAIACLGGMLLVKEDQEAVPLKARVPADASSVSFWNLSEMTVFLIAILGFYSTCWKPSLAVSSWQGRVPMSFEQGIADAEFAMKEDPWDPKPARAVVQMQAGELQRLSQLAGRSTKELEEKLAKSIDVWLSRDPDSWSALAEVGSLQLQLGVFKPNYIAESVKNYKKATLFNPTEAWLQVQLAIAFELAGQYQEAKEALQRGLEIDEKTVHLDRKLKAGSLFWPSIPGKAKPPEGMSGWIGAEPAAQQLRRVLESTP